MPKVSVIVPIYGVEKYIERCARSLFEQTLDDIEFIFVDDCSPDHSIEILKQVMEEYKVRIKEMNYTTRIERMPTNSGQAAVRRHGIQLCSGDYIIHCDSDDWVELDMYQKMYEKAENDKVDVVICNYSVTDGVQRKKIESSQVKTPTKFIESCLLQRDSWSLCNKLFNRKVYYNEIIYPNGDMGEDMTIVFQLMGACRTLSYISDSLYNYFFNPNSITKVFTKEVCIRKYEQLESNAQIVISYLNESNLTSQMPDAIISYKNFIRSILFPIVGDRKYYKIWNSLFVGLNKQVILSKSIPVKDKVITLLTIVHLYPRKQCRAK